MALSVGSAWLESDHGGACEINNLHKCARGMFFACGEVDGAAAAVGRIIKIRFGGVLLESMKAFFLQRVGWL